MRTIKFRGKDVETGEWIYGDLFQRIGYYPEIITTYPDDNGKIAYKGITVKPETVGQFTGLLDKNGKEIYEGDIIKIEDEGVMLNPKVVDFSNGMFGAGEWSLAYYGEDIIEIIGNIHDNPELLKNND